MMMMMASPPPPPPPQPPAASSLPLEATTAPSSPGSGSYSRTAYRIFHLMRHLVRHRALNQQAIHQLWEDEPALGRAFNSDTVLKSINLLREMGLTIPKATRDRAFHYILAHSPFPQRITQAELLLCCQVLQRLALSTDVRLHRAGALVMQQLAWGLWPDQAAELRQSLQETLPDHHRLAESTPQAGLVLRGALRTATATRSAQACEQIMDAENDESVAGQTRQAIERFVQQACQQGLQLAVQLQWPGYPEPVEGVVDVYQCWHNGQQPHVLLREADSQVMCSLPLSAIQQAKVLPTRCQALQQPTAVVYRLYGRLAVGYRPYPDETLQLLQAEEPTLEVTAWVEDTTPIFQRIMKYGHWAEIVAPASLRQRAIQQLERQLAACSSADKP